STGGRATFASGIFNCANSWRTPSGQFSATTSNPIKKAAVRKTPGVGIAGGLGRAGLGSGRDGWGESPAAGFGRGGATGAEGLGKAAGSGDEGTAGSLIGDAAGLGTAADGGGAA
ncbi:MAG: hypothetical protein DME25_19640, partial [Verrucomicrobia bacterium]